MVNNNYYRYLNDSSIIFQGSPHVLCFFILYLPKRYGCHGTGIFCYLLDEPYDRRQSFIEI